MGLIGFAVESQSKKLTVLFNLKYAAYEPLLNIRMQQTYLEYLLQRALSSHAKRAGQNRVAHIGQTLWLFIAI